MRGYGRNGRGRGGGRGFDGGGPDDPSLPSPGKRPLTHRLGRRRATRESAATWLGVADAQIRSARSAIPALQEAVDPRGPRDIQAARDAARAFEDRVSSAKTALADAEADAKAAAPDLLGDVEAARTRLGAVRAEAAPLLARRPPSYAQDGDHEKARWNQDPDAIERLDAAEAREREDWNATLDGTTRESAPQGDDTEAHELAALRDLASPAGERLPAHETAHTLGEGSEAAANENAATAPSAAAVVQRKQTSAPGLTDERIVAAATAGVEGASAPLPHLDAIQESFGRHDVTGVRAQIGGDGAAAAGAIGAQAYAVGDRAAFASSAPDLFTAAHEATHVVQQRAGVSLLGGVGEAGDRHEQEADAVAEAVVAGRSAEPLLDQMSERAGGATRSVQRKLGATLVPASQYLTGSNARELAEAVERHLGSVDWIQPDPRLPWRSQEPFKRALVAGLFEPILGSSEPGQHLRKLCHPANPLTLIDQMRPVERAHSGKLLEAIEPAAGALVGSAKWQPSIGLAIAQLLEASIIASLRRLGSRWVACADRGMSEEARLDETWSLVPYDALITSHPIDRIVGRAITGEAVFDFQEDPERTAAATSEPVAGGIRPVTVEWQGDRDPTLWNWVKADPPDASAEEVAAALFAGAEKKDGERRTFLAYLLTPAPPLFGVAPSTAIGFAGAKRHAPADGKDPGPDERVMAVASGVATDEIALHQGGDEVLPVAGEDGAKAALRDLVSGNQLQLQYLVGVLAPWGLAEPVGHALGFLLGKQGELMASADANVAGWARVLTAQRANLQRVGAGVRQVTDKASELGLTDPAAPEAAALRDVLAAYARAAGTSHLADTSRALLDEAAGKQAGLALLAVQGSSRGLDVAMDQLRVGTGTDDRLRTGYLRQGAELQEQSVALQSRMLAGESVPAEELDQITLQADMLALRARVRTVSAQLDALEQAARTAGKGLAQELAAAMSSGFRGVAPTCAAMRATINVALTQMDQEMAPPTVYPGQQVGEDARRRQRVYDAGPKDPRQSLRAAEEKFREIAGNEEFVQFLRHGASLVEWQGFRTACIQVAALVGVGIVAGAAGGLVGDAVGGMMARAGAAESIAELSLGARLVGGTANIATDAAINVAGQHTFMDLEESLGESFAENLMISAGALGILRTLEANAERIAQVERATAGLWQKVKGGTLLVLKEGAAITGHTIMGAALGYASHKIVTGKSQPAPETAREWFLQGASMAVGRYVGQSVQTRIQHLRRLGGLGDRLFKRAQDLQELAARAEQKPEAHDALELLNRRHELLVEELRLLENLLGDDAAMGRAKLKRGEVFEMMTELETQLGSVHASGGADITLHLAGLEELVPGAVWRGSREDIDRAVDSAKLQAKDTGRTVESIRDDKTGTWKVTIDGRRYEIHERAPAGGADRAVAPAVEQALTLPPEAEARLSSPPPLADQIEAVTGVEKGPAYAQAMADLRQFYAGLEAEAKHVSANRGHATDGPYAWGYAHDARAFSHGLYSVEVRVRLDAGAGVSDAEVQKVKTRVQSAVDQYYNFDKTVRDSRGKAGRLHVEIVFVDSAADAHLNVRVMSGNGVARPDRLYVEGHATTDAHEIGHGAFGLKDEYYDPTVPGRDTPNGPGVTADDSLMGNYWADPSLTTARPGTSLKDRHLDEIGSLMPVLRPGTSSSTTAPSTTSAAATNAAPAPIARSVAAQQLAAIPIVATQDPSAGGSISYVVDDTDAARIVALAPHLGPDVQVRELPRGVLVRSPDGEVFLERSSLTAGRATDSKASEKAVATRTDTGLPASNVASVEYYGFRGVRTVRGAKLADLPAQERAEIQSMLDAEPLLKYGHVGVSVDGGKTIWGFTPDERSRPEMSGAEFISYLKTNASVPGLVRDDSKVFARAQRLAQEEGWNTEVDTAVQIIEPEKKQALVEQIESMSERSGKGAGTGHGKRYQFPYDQPKDGSHFESDACRNCATFMEFLGLAVPEASGLLALYIPALKKWAAQSPLDQRKTMEKK